MRLILVLNALNGEFISKFPEKEYITQENFCLDDQACVCRTEGDGTPQCLNFFQAALFNKTAATCEVCRCVQNRCTVGP